MLISYTNLIILLILLSLGILGWGNYRYWKGYREGFCEGRDSGLSTAKEEWDNYINNGGLDRAIDNHLDKDELVRKTMSETATLVVAAKAVWKKYGIPGDQLDHALKQFPDPDGPSTTDTRPPMPAPCGGMAQNCQWVDGVSTSCSCMR